MPADRLTTLALLCALAACGGSRSDAEPQFTPAKPSPLAEQKPAATTPPPEQPPPEAPPPDKPSDDMVGFPKPGWSKVSIDDTLPLCVFSSYVAREEAEFLKQVTKQKLHADATVTFGAFGPGCVNESCDGLPSLQCNVEMADKTLTVHAHYFGYKKDGSTCTENCRRVTAGCASPELPAGKYKVVYGDKTFNLKIPAVLRDPCFVR